MMDDEERCKVLLVGPLPEPPLLGGIEVGVEMVLTSDLARETNMCFFNTWRVEDSSRSMWQRISYQVASCWRFASQIIHRNCLIVHVKTASGINFLQNALYATIARCLGRRVILQIHGGYFPNFYRDSNPILQSIIRISLRIPDRLLVLSEYWAKYFEDLVGRTSISIAPNATYTEQYRLAEPDRERFGIPAGRFAILFMGTRDYATEESKGIVDLIGAAAKLRKRYPQLLLVVAGSGSHRREIKRALGNEGESWIGVGAVTADVKPILYSSVDLFVLPSHIENMPNTLIEAMAAGVPAVATSVGAVPEMIKDGKSGFIVSPRDSAALAIKIEALINDPELRVSMSIAAAKTAQEEYDFPTLQTRLAQEYEKLI